MTRYLTAAEVAEAYELNTGRVIAELFRDKDPLAQPGVLVAGHAPFTWGKNPMKAVENAIALEAMARMARLTEAVRMSEPVPPLPDYILEKHYQRKHGPNAYYGQKK